MIRARFAPSSTGYLHIGSARTFTSNWFYVRQNAGTIGLRIDHTDVDRVAANPEFTEASVEAELRKPAAERGVKAKLLINGSCAALTGQMVSPSAFAVFVCISREGVIERLGKL